MKDWLDGIRHKAPFMALALSIVLSSGIATTAFAKDEDNGDPKITETTETAEEGVDIPDDEEESPEMPESAA